MTVSVVLRGRDESLARTNRQVARSAGEVDTAYTEAARSSRRFANQGRASMRQLESATERYRRELRGLIELQRQGAISQERFQELRGRLRESITSREQGTIFGAIPSQVRVLASSLAAFGTALGFASQFAQAAAEANRALAEAQLAAIPTTGRLAQLAATPADFARLTGLAEQVRGFGVREEQANRLVFALESAGATLEDAGIFGRAEAAGVIDAIQAVNAAATVSRAFEGQTNRTLAELSGQAIAVARDVARAEASQIQAGVARSGAAAFAAGVDVEQTTAAIGTLTNVLGDAAIASTRLRALFTALEREGIELQAGDFVRTLEELDDAGRLNIKTLRTQEALEAGRIVVRLSDQFRELLDAARRASGELPRSTAIALGRETQQAAVGRIAAEENTAVQRAERGRLSNELAIIRENVRRTRVAPELFTNVALSDTAVELFNFIAGGGVLSPLIRNVTTDPLVRSQADALRIQQESLEETKRNTQAVQQNRQAPVQSGTQEFGF